MSTPGDGEPLSPAEHRLAQHLEIVRRAPPRDGRSLVTAVVHRARRQRALREPLQLIGTIAAALFEGIGGLLGARRRRSR